MANAFVFDVNHGGTPFSPTNMFVIDFSIDTYATGGVAIDAAILALADYKATKVDLSSTFTGFINLDANAASAPYTAFFDHINRKIILNVDAGVLAQEGAGAIGATITGKLTLFLR